MLILIYLPFTDQSCHCYSVNVDHIPVIFYQSPNLSNPIHPIHKPWPPASLPARRLTRIICLRMISTLIFLRLIIRPELVILVSSVLKPTLVPTDQELLTSTWPSSMIISICWLPWRHPLALSTTCCMIWPYLCRRLKSCSVLIRG